MKMIMTWSPRSAVEPRPAQPSPVPTTGFAGVLSSDAADRTAGASRGDIATLDATGLTVANLLTLDDRTGTHRVRVETEATAESTYPGVHLPAD